MGTLILTAADWEYEAITQMHGGSITAAGLHCGLTSQFTVKQNSVSFS